MEFITELKVKCMTTIVQCQGERCILLKYTYYIHKVVSPQGTLLSFKDVYYKP